MADGTQSERPLDESDNLLSLPQTPKRKRANIAQLPLLPSPPTPADDLFAHMSYRTSLLGRTTKSSLQRRHRRNSSPNDDDFFNSFRKKCSVVDLTREITFMSLPQDIRFNIYGLALYLPGGFLSIPPTVRNHENNFSYHSLIGLFQANKEISKEVDTYFPMFNEVRFETASDHTTRMKESINQADARSAEMRRRHTKTMSKIALFPQIYFDIYYWIEEASDTLESRDICEAALEWLRELKRSNKRPHRITIAVQAPVNVCGIINRRHRTLGRFQRLVVELRE